MMPALYLPTDSLARAVGADEVAVALITQARERNLPLELQRTSSRGLYWLEPLLEVDSPQGRIGFGPLTAADVPSVLEALQGEPSAHPLALGLVEELPYLKSQQRLLFARAGITRPLSLDDYRAHGGFEGLNRAVTVGGEQAATEVFDSGLRGRGGAAFPAGIKWRTVRATQAEQKYIVCNADEGDSGTFSDRMMMEGDPFVLIEGMAIAGIAVGATHGYIYVRSEYPHADARLREAIETAGAPAIWAPNVGGSGKAFDLEVRRRCRRLHLRRGNRAAGQPRRQARHRSLQAADACLEGLVRQADCGATTCITLASVPMILDKGAQFYRDYGMGRSRGTLPFQLAGNIKHGGLVEKAFGLTLRELLYDYGGGTASGRPMRLCRSAARSAPSCPKSQFDTPLDYEAFAAIGAMLGHGGVVVFDDTVDMAHMARYAMEFCADRILWQMHAVPHRLDPRRGSDRPHRCRDDRRSREQRRSARGPVRHHDTVRCARWAA